MTHLSRKTREEVPLGIADELAASGRAAFEGHPVTLHRNCVRENPFYVPRAQALA